MLLTGLVVACGSNETNTPSLSEATETTSTNVAPTTVLSSTPPSTAMSVAEPTPGPGFDTDIFEELNPRPELRSVDRSIDFGFDENEAIPRDAINPVYSPKFVTADEVAEQMLDNELVMGLNINGDARAYPVGIMRFREIVNDEVGGIPLLVTW